MTPTRLTLTLLAAVLSGCATPSKPPRQPVGDIVPGSFEVAWSADTGIKTPLAFHLAGDTLFLYDKGNVVSGFDTNGSLQFRSSVGENNDLIGPPIVQPTRIIFPTGGALELFTRKGVRTRVFTLPQPIRSPGVAVDEFVYFGSDSETGGRLSAVELTRQFNVNRWTRLTGIVNTQPVLFDNALYLATDDGRVYAVNQDGSPLWGQGPEKPNNYFRTDGKIIAAIKVDEAGVFVPSMDTKLYCLSPNNGQIRWTYYAGVPLTSSPVVTADMVYQLVDGPGLVALAKKPKERAATPVWSYPSGLQVVADDAKYAYVHTTRGTVVALNKADGSLAFETRRSDLARVVTNLDPKAPAVFAITTDGTLVCIKPVLKTGVVGELAMLVP